MKDADRTSPLLLPKMLYPNNKNSIKPVTKKENKKIRKRFSNIFSFLEWVIKN